MNTKIKYLIVFLITVLLTIIIGRAILFALSLLEFILFFILHEQGSLVARKISGTLAVEKNSCYVDEEIQIYVKLKNRSKFPVSNVLVECQVTDPFSNKTIGLKGNAMLDGNSEATLTFQLKEEYYTSLKIELTSIMIRDLLGIDQYKCKIRSPLQTVTTLPSLQETTVSTVDGTYNDDETQTLQTFRKQAFGDNYEVVEMEPGDPLHNIHWKISARLNELMVKRYNSGRIDSLYIILNPITEKEIERDTWQSFIEKVSSISYKLVQDHQNFTVSWMHSLAGTFQYRINDEQSLRIMLINLIGCATGNKLGFERWSETLEYEKDIIEISLYKVSYYQR